MSGVDSGGYAFQRLTPTAISAIRPRAPAVTMPTLTRGYYDNPVTLSCHVQSLVPYELRWFRDNKQLGNTLHYRWSLSQINFVVARFAIATPSSADAFEKFSPCFLMKRCLRCWESFASSYRNSVERKHRRAIRTEVSILFGRWRQCNVHH